MSEAGGAAAGAFKVNSLSGLDRADAVEGRVLWDGNRSIWNMAMLIIALVLGPMTFGWSALAVFLLTSAVTLCAGHSVGLEPEFRLNTTGLQAGAYLLRWVVDGHTKATAPLIVVQP